MKVIVVTTVSIDATTTCVFKYLSNLTLHPLWNPQIEHLSSTKILELGDAYNTVSRMLGIQITSTNVVAKFVNNKEFEIKNDTGAVHYTANFKLKNSKGATTLVCKTSVTPTSKYFAFAKPVLEILARRELQSGLQLLKAAAEKESNPKIAK